MEQRFDDIRRELETLWRARGLERFFSLDVLASSTSTMDEASRRLRLREPSDFGLACFSLEQTAGRGTKGRTWHSEAAEGIYVTFGWCLAVAAPTAGISLVTGLAVLQLCHALGVSAFLKWPNDVVVSKGSEFRKLGGVLCETASQPQGPSEILLGIGLNLGQRRFPPEVPGVSLSQLLGSRPSYAAVAVELAERIHQVVHTFFSEGFSQFADEYNRFSILNGRSLKYRSGSMSGHGQVLRVADDGALLVFDPERGETQPLYSAELQL